MAYFTRNRYEDPKTRERFSQQEPSIWQTQLRERSTPVGHIHVTAQYNLKLPSIREDNINKFKDAVRCLNKAIEMNPQNESARHMKREILDSLADAGIYVHDDEPGF